MKSENSNKKSKAKNERNIYIMRFVILPFHGCIFVAIRKGEKERVAAKGKQQTDSLGYKRDEKTFRL